jgi:hypothetical protein
MSDLIFATKNTPGAILVNVGELRKKGAAVDKKNDLVLTIVHVNYCPFPPIFHRGHIYPSS